MRVRSTLLHKVSRRGIAHNDMLEDKKIETVKTRIIRNDNMTCIWYSEHPGSHEKTKNIIKQFYYAQQHVAEGNVKLEFCPSTENLAGLLTKSLSVEQLDFVKTIITYVWGSGIDDM